MIEYYISLYNTTKNILPNGFTTQVSGLTNHQLTSEKPLKYSHFDKGDTYGKLPHPTTGATVVALAMHLLQEWKFFAFLSINTNL